MARRRKVNLTIPRVKAAQVLARDPVVVRDDDAAARLGGCAGRKALLAVPLAGLA